MQIHGFDIESLRAALRTMPDSELLRFGQTAKRLAARKSTQESRRLRLYAVKLCEAREERRRRHPELPLSESI
jgi:hypothetical protein